jgi:hypothetical protein
MQSAATVLKVLHDRGQRGLPVQRRFRQLTNPDLYRRAYARLYRNDGALPPGTTPETVDGMALAKIEAIIAAVRQERSRWRPVRRVLIEQRHSAKKRPLGLPSWSDKLLQEVGRSLLNAYYEPQCSRYAHGFRPGRGCHTALTAMHETWKGTVGGIEGDIAAGFSSLDHEILLVTLAEQIHDQRFLRLVAQRLKAGYLEDWRYHPTPSGVPQGAVASPVLSNVYGRLCGREGTVSLMTPCVGGNARPYPGVARHQAPCHGELPEDSTSRARDAAPQEANVWDRTRRVSRSVAKTRRDNGTHTGSGGETVWKMVSVVEVYYHGSDLRKRVGLVGPSPDPPPSSRPA